MIPWAAWLRKSVPHTDLTIPICEMGSYQTRFLRVLLVLFLEAEAGKHPWKARVEAEEHMGKWANRVREGERRTTPPDKFLPSLTLPGSSPWTPPAWPSFRLPFSPQPGPSARPGPGCMHVMNWRSKLLRENLWTKWAASPAAPAGAGKAPWNQADMVCESKTCEYISQCVGERGTRTRQLHPQKGAWEGTDQLVSSGGKTRGWGPQAVCRNGVLNTH